MQTFLTFFTTDFLLSPDLLDQQPPLVPLFMVFPSHLEGLFLRPKIFSPKSHAVVRTLLINSQPFLEAVFPKKDSKNFAYAEVEELSTWLLSVLRNDSMQSAPADVQSSVFLYLLSLTLLPHTIVPWAILELFNQNSPLHAYSKEIQEVVDKKVTISQEPGIGVIKPPPTLNINVGTDSAISHLLEEVIAKYARGYNEYYITKNVTLEESEAAGFSKHKWDLEEGDDVVVARWLSDKDGASSVDSKTTASIEEAFNRREYLGDGIRPILIVPPVGLFQLPAVSSFLTKLYPAVIAGFLKFYKIEPVAKAGWIIPGAKFALGIALPKQDIRVRVRKRYPGQKAESFVVTE
jgi:hypothetical protein